MPTGNIVAGAASITRLVLKSASAALELKLVSVKPACSLGKNI